MAAVLDRARIVNMNSGMHIHVRTATLVSLVMALILPMSALAFGQITEPIEVKNARRGQVIKETLLLNNRGANAKDERFVLSGQGDIAKWVEFFLPGDLQTPLTEVPVKAGQTADAVAKITVPKDAANGTYKGTLTLAMSAASQEKLKETGVTVSRSISRPVEITVTDKEDIKAEVSVIPESYDVKPGEVLKVRVVYRNLGNIQIAPQVQVKVRVAEIDGPVMVDTIFPYPESVEPIKALASGEVTYTVTTNSLTERKYRAEVVSTFKDVELYRDDFLFAVNAKAGEIAGASTGVAGGMNPLYVVGGIGAVVVLAGLGMMLARRRA